MERSGVRQALAAEADALLTRLFPICRSITGDGVRRTLEILSEVAPWQVAEIPSGTVVYDWTVPPEWVIRGAWIADSSGRRLVDFATCNLHVVGYSEPVRTTMSFAELRPRLHTLPGLPAAVPYRTSYYKRSWGFCLSQEQLEAFDPDASYEVVIDSQLRADGSLTLADQVLPGESGEEFLVSTYCCHPSMANDNLSGPIVATLLMRELAARGRRRHSWRFVMVPETIGAIGYLAGNEAAMKRCAGGFVVTTCGGPGPFGVKESYLGNHLVDRAVALAFRDAGLKPLRYLFVPDGSDERQYSSPGFRIPVTTIAKDKYYEYPYYHTSLDNLNFVTGENLVASLGLYLDAVDIIEGNWTPCSTNPHCEVQLGRRGLYPQTGGAINQQARAGDDKSVIENEVDVIGWIMFLADGRHDLIGMAERSGLPVRHLATMAAKLAGQGLLVAAPSSSSPMSVSP